MLLITIWSTMASIPFADALRPGLLQSAWVPFSVGAYGLTSALRIVGFIAALEFGLAIVVALACWLVLELAGILVEGRKPSTATKSAPTCANQLSFRDDFDLPANARR
jgi:uncharacterized membrane protein